MNYRIIKSPTEGTMEILLRRMTADETMKNTKFDAIGLVQGLLLDMVFAADIAEKAGSVIVKDIRGSCPQNMILLALFGDTSSVEASIDAIKQSLSKQKKAGD